MDIDFSQISWSPQVEEDCRRIVRLAVFEDLDRGYDWTTVALAPEGATASAQVVAREGGDVEDQSFPFVHRARRRVCLRQQVIRLQEDQAGRERGALVAVDERMVRDQGEAKRSRLLQQRCVEIGALERRPGLCQRR